MFSIISKVDRIRWQKPEQCHYCHIHQKRVYTSFVCRDVDTQYLALSICGNKRARVVRQEILFDSLGHSN